MAYANVNTPRFYINYLLWGHSLGGTEIDEFTDGNPSNIHSFGSGGHREYKLTGVTHDSRPNFVAYLGHNLASQSAGIRHYYEKENGDWNDGHALGDIVNGANGQFTPFSINTGSDYVTPAYDGFSICSIDNDSADGMYYKSKFAVLGDSDTADIKVGTAILGRTYDMPHSPDLNLKLTYEYDGVKTIQTKGGSTLSNAMYTKPADWGSAGAWQLGTNTSNLRSGRRVWDLSFSYLSDSDVFPVNASQSLAAYTNTDYNTTSDPVDINTGSANGGTAGEFTSNILDGTDFFSQVWNKTMGGHLPFIFQPDGSNNNPDQFAIARFDMKSLTYDQVANNVYNVKLKIRECW